MSVVPCLLHVAMVSKPANLPSSHPKERVTHVLYHNTSQYLRRHVKRHAPRKLASPYRTYSLTQTVAMASGRNTACSAIKLTADGLLAKKLLSCPSGGSPAAMLGGKVLMSKFASAMVRGKSVVSPGQYQLPHCTESWWPVVAMVTAARNGRMRKRDEDERGIRW